MVKLLAGNKIYVWSASGRQNLIKTSAFLFTFSYFIRATFDAESGFEKSAVPSSVL